MAPQEQKAKAYQAMKKEAWIKNVLRIFPNITRSEAEALYEKILSAK